MPGNLRGAQRAVESMHEFGRRSGDITLPRGVKFLGEGSYRAAFLISGTVYKVAFDGYDFANVTEYENIMKGRAEGYGKYLPPADLWYVEAEDDEVPVIAMPYYEKSMRHLEYGSPLMKGLWRLIGTLPEYLKWDAGGDNVRFTPKGRLRLTDVQEV